MNQFWYSYYSCAAGWFCCTKALAVKLPDLQVCDSAGCWTAVDVPGSIKAIVVLNLQSYGAGRHLWGSRKARLERRAGPGAQLITVTATPDRASPPSGRGLRPPAPGRRPAGGGGLWQRLLLGGRHGQAHRRAPPGAGPWRAPAPARLARRGRRREQGAPAAGRRALAPAGAWARGQQGRTEVPRGEGLEGFWDHRVGVRGARQGWAEVQASVCNACPKGGLQPRNPPLRSR